MQGRSRQSLLVSDRYHIERKAMRATFDRASATYDDFAVIQGRVRNELVERLELVGLEPKVVLDLGAATGASARALEKRYPGALVVALDLAPAMLRRAAEQSVAVCADAAGLPFAPASVDLVHSNLMLQWCDDPGRVFAEAKRVLKPGGFLAFTTFGPDTLQELRSAWAAADGFTHVNRFIDMHDIGDALVRAGFLEPVMDVERIRVTYSDVRALMRDLKAIGAHNVTAGRARGLTGRTRLARMIEAYESWRSDGRLPATYEVVYGAAWRGEEPSAAKLVAGEAHIPAGSIRRRFS
jgi:malonyl-CoA O-methyltransferase